MSDDVKIKPWMWREAIRNSPKKTVPAHTRHVLYVISDFLNYEDIRNGTVIGVEKLIIYTSLSNRAIANHLENARRAGLLEISGRETDDWRQQKRSIDRNGQFAASRYYPRFPEWAEARLRQRLDEAKNGGSRRQPSELKSHGPRERGSRGPRELQNVHHVNEGHAIYISNDIDSIDSAKGAPTRATDLKSDLEKMGSEPNPVVARGLPELAQSFRRDPVEEPRTTVSIDNSRLQNRPMVIQKTNPYWRAWIQYHSQMGNDELVHAALDSGKITVTSIRPPNPPQIPAIVGDFEDR